MERLSAPLDVQIELTSQCNQECRHCYNYWRHSLVKDQDELGMNDYSMVIDQLRDAKVGLVTFTGGEPMLRKEILLKLIALATSYGIETGLNTNAALIQCKDARALKEQGLKHVLVSVLGPEDIHNTIAGAGGNYGRTIKGIESLLAVNLSVAVNMVVSKMNLDFIFDTALALKRLGVSTFCAGPMLPSCRANIPLCLSGVECKRCLRELMRIDKELSLKVDVLEPVARCLFGEREEAEFVRFFGNRICSAAVSSCVVSSAGTMRPCVHSDVVFGNVLPDKFLSTWLRMKSWASPKMLPEECRTCNALMLCEGGCRMAARITSGRYNGRDMYMTTPIIDPQRAALISIEGDNISFGETYY